MPTITLTVPQPIADRIAAALIPYSPDLENLVTPKEFIIDSLKNLVIRHERTVAEAERQLADEDYGIT